MPVAYPPLPPGAVPAPPGAPYASMVTEVAHDGTTNVCVVNVGRYVIDPLGQGPTTLTSCVVVELQPFASCTVNPTPFVPPLANDAIGCCAVDVVCDEAGPPSNAMMGPL
jgi:hypothetical protein